MYRKLLPLFLALTLAACQTTTPFPENFNGKAKINDYELEIICEGTGEPTIILENGSNFKSWDETSTTRFSGITRTCRYLRAGMGTKISGRRTAQDLAQKEPEGDPGGEHALACARRSRRAHDAARGVDELGQGQLEQTAALGGEGSVHTGIPPRGLTRHGKYMYIYMYYVRTNVKDKMKA